MTEEDTFNALKRTPFEEVWPIVTQWVWNLNDMREIDELLAKYSWTLEEWKKERNRHRNNQLLQS